jgi:hypothetical protein
VLAVTTHPNKFQALLLQNSLLGKLLVLVATMGTEVIFGTHYYDNGNRDNCWLTTVTWITSQQLPGLPMMSLLLFSS